MSLHPVLGYASLRAPLAKAVLGGTLPPTLLFHGPRGAGKQRLGLWMGAMLLCEAPGPDDPCGRCRSCRLSLRVEHPDLHWYFPLPRPARASTPKKLAEALETARAEALAEFRARPTVPSHRDDARSLYLAVAKEIRRRAQRRPSMSSRQVFVIADAETLVPQESSPEAANALLKLLEEPPGSTVFVLTSSEPGRLLPTIRSRALPLHVPGIEQTLVERFLTEYAGADEASATRAASLARGSCGRALGFLEAFAEAGQDETRIEALDLLEAALAPRPGPAFARALSYKAWGGRGLLDLLSWVEEWLRDLAALAVGSTPMAAQQGELRRLERLARGIRPDTISDAIASVDQARIAAAGNVNPQLLVAGLMFDLGAALGRGPRAAARAE